THLHRHQMTVDGALPNRIAGFPGRDQKVWIAKRAVGALEANRDASRFTHNIEFNLRAVKPHRAPAFALHRPAGQLAGNLPLAFAEHMIDRRPNRGQPPRDLTFRIANRESLRKFFRYEAGRQLALTPARMKHQRRQEWDVVADAVDVE